MLKKPKPHTSQIMKHIIDKHDMTDTSQYSVNKGKKRGSLNLPPIFELVTPASTPKPTQEVSRLAVQTGKQQTFTSLLPHPHLMTTEDRITFMWIMAHPNNVQVRATGYAAAGQSSPSFGQHC